jgi:uncharacterized protein YjbJ (UPF0337 family)
MSAYDPTRHPGGDDPLRGAPPDDLSIDEEIVADEEERVLGRRADDEAPAAAESGEEAIDEQGRNPTQRAIDEDAAQGSFRAPVSGGESRGRTSEEGEAMDQDRVEGKVKEVGGKVTGDESLEREGEAQGTWGKAKDKARDVWDDVKDRFDSDDDREKTRTGP